MIKVYLAAPLFTIGEREFNATLCNRLRTIGYDVFLPQEHQFPEAIDIFKSDVSSLEEADAVVAVIDGADPDSGTSWECGFAYAQNKPVILVKTDFRMIADAKREPCNLMISQSAKGFIDASAWAFERNSSTTCTDIANSIDEQMKNLFF